MSRMQVDEDAKTRCTVRVPTHLLEQFDEHVDERDTNRSEEMRRLMRAAIDGPSEDRGKIPPQDDPMLARGYEAIRGASAGRSMRLEAVQSIVASVCGVKKEATHQRVIQPLANRGYLKIQGNMYETRVRVT